MLLLDSKASDQTSSLSIPHTDSWELRKGDLLMKGVAVENSLG